MFALTRVCEGLLVGHCFLAITFLVGAAAFPWFLTERSAGDAPAAMLRVVLTCGLGIAICAVALFALAQLHLFTTFAIALTFVALLAAGALAWRESPLQKQYWAARARVVWDGLDGPTTFVYYLLVLAAVPCVIPNVGGDPIQYHLAYAQDWVNAHGFVVDPYLRFPFYASYFTLFFGALLAMHGWAFLNFLTWATSLMTALALTSASVWMLPNTGKFWSSIAAVAIALAVVFSPAAFRWGTTAYMDVQLGAVALLTVAAIGVALRERKGQWIVVAAALAGLLIGMKSAFLALAPVFAAACAAAAWQLRISKRAAFAAVAVFIIACAPWFVRNFVLAGDPIAPIANLALHGTDGLTSKSDWDGIMADLKTDRSAAGLLLVPARAFFRPLSHDFRDYGTSALIFFLYVPPLLLFLSFCAGRRIEFEWAIPVAVLSVLTAYWLLTASHLRYGLVVFPVLGFCCMLAAARWMRAYPRAAAAVALLAVLAMLPWRDGMQYYLETTHIYYRYLAVLYDDDDTYLRLHDQGYIEEEFAADYFRAHHLSGRVYSLGGATAYFFRAHGIASAGDWVGPASYFRLYHATDLGRLAWFMNDLQVRGIIIEPGFAFAGLDVPIERQLVAAGFRRVAIPGSDYVFLVNERNERPRART